MFRPLGTSDQRLRKNIAIRRECVPKIRCNKSKVAKEN
ncbi:unnamed protein product [Brugia timori]|uniref:Uncharacterized protein n=1 Tax=Brugia timori TaxID=42155 RepID=A0A0R3QH25_9BILA|nr:unnamed protein product [Brugia timori]